MEKLDEYVLDCVVVVREDILQKNKEKEGEKERAILNFIFDSHRKYYL